MAKRVLIFDDVLWVRREVFHIPGLEILLYGDADESVAQVATSSPDVLFMDYAMGREHANGVDAIRALRKNGYSGKIVAMSSDPAANAMMISAGADETLSQKALLRSYLVKLGSS